MHARPAVSRFPSGLCAAIFLHAARCFTCHLHATCEFTNGLHATCGIANSLHATRTMAIYKWRSVLWNAGTEWYDCLCLGTEVTVNSSHGKPWPAYSCLCM